MGDVLVCDHLSGVCGLVSDVGRNPHIVGECHSRALDSQFRNVQVGQGLANVKLPRSWNVL